MYSVNFISVDDEDDLVVSFYIVSEDGLDTGHSLNLLRDRKWESLVTEEAKGVKVSDEGIDDGSLNSVFLTKIALSDGRAALETTRTRYELDLRRVDPSEVADAKSVLEKMNFDKRFELEFA